MSSLLLSSRCSSAVAQRAARRTARCVNGVKPFAPIRGHNQALRAVAREAEETDPELVEDIDLKQYEQLVAQVEEEDLLEQLLAEDIAAVDPEVKAYLEQEKIKTVEEAFRKVEAGVELSEAEKAVIDDVAASLGELEVVEPEDVVNIKSFTAVDEEEVTNLPAEQQQTLEDLKLSKEELKGLVPKDWDTLTIDWFNAPEGRVPLPQYRLNLLYLEKNIGVSVDQIYSRGQTSPLTEYFFWPRKDGWEELRMALEARPWIKDTVRIALLNRLTEVINFWQEEETKHTIEEARAMFPDCVFTGQNGE